MEVAGGQEDLDPGFAELGPLLVLLLVVEVVGNSLKSQEVQDIKWSRESNYW